MSVRLGTESRPAVALLDRQVRHLDDDLEKQFTSGASLRATKLEIARAATVNLISWIGLACRVYEVAMHTHVSGRRWTETSYLTINSRPPAASQGTKALPAILNN